jgi:GTP cyclohydrolase I
MRVAIVRAGRAAQAPGSRRSRGASPPERGRPAAPGRREPSDRAAGGRGIDASTRAEAHVRALLEEIGETPERAGLIETPRRVRESLAFLTQGYQQDPAGVVGAAIFEEAYDELVLVKDIAFYSLCEHHLLPFFGTAHVAYLPNGRLVGLSKLPRLVDIFARRLQVQERLTAQIAESLQALLQPHGVGVVLEASHLCMMMRGVQKQGSTMLTSCLLGRFKTDDRIRAEFLDRVRGR